MKKKKGHFNVTIYGEKGFECVFFFFLHYFIGSKLKIESLNNLFLLFFLFNRFSLPQILFSSVGGQKTLYAQNSISLSPSPRTPQSPVIIEPKIPAKETPVENGKRESELQPESIAEPEVLILFCC